MFEVLLLEISGGGTLRAVFRSRRRRGGGGARRSPRTTGRVQAWGARSSRQAQLCGEVAVEVGSVWGVHWGRERWVLLPEPPSPSPCLWLPVEEDRRPQRRKSWGAAGKG